MPIPTLKNDSGAIPALNGWSSFPLTQPFGSLKAEVAAINQLLGRQRRRLARTRDFNERLRLLVFIEHGQEMRRKMLRLIRQNGE